MWIRAIAPGAAAGAAVAASAWSGLQPAAVALIAGAAAVAAGIVTGLGGSGRTDRARVPAPDAPPAPAALPAGAGRDVLEHLPAAVILIDGDGTVRFMNRAAEALLGRRPPGDFPMAALRAPPLLEAVESALRQRAPVSVEFTLARAADLHLRAHIRPLAFGDTPAGGRPGILVMIEDHSQARRGAELHRDFVANASHELKTPLAAISGLIETLQGHARGDAEAEERFLGLIAAEAGRMASLVEDLLSLNRIEINERVRPSEPQALGPIVAGVVETLGPAAEAAGMKLMVTGLDDAPTVPGSRTELAQALTNLIDNAIKYGRPGTPVEVEVVGSSAARPGMVGVSVTDQGPGIAREDIPRLTERFYRVSVARSRAKGGTGLGLAIVKHVVNRHRGALEISSTPGQGSRFTIWLPVVPVAPKPAGAEAERAPS